MFNPSKRCDCSSPHSHPVNMETGQRRTKQTQTRRVWKSCLSKGLRLRRVFSSPFAETVIGLGLKTNWEFIWWPKSVILTNQKAEAGLRRKLCLSAIVSLPSKFKTKQNTKAPSLGEAQWQTPCLAWVSHCLPPPAAWKKRKITAKDLPC